jgi:hypothetical protein
MDVSASFETLDRSRVARASSIMRSCWSCRGGGSFGLQHRRSPSTERTTRRHRSQRRSFRRSRSPYNESRRSPDAPHCRARSSSLPGRFPSAGVETPHRRVRGHAAGLSPSAAAFEPVHVRVHARVRVNAHDAFRMNLRNSGSSHSRNQPECSDRRLGVHLSDSSSGIRDRARCGRHLGHRDLQPWCRMSSWRSC